MSEGRCHKCDTLFGLLFDSRRKDRRDGSTAFFSKGVAPIWKREKRVVILCTTYDGGGGTGSAGTAEKNGKRFEVPDATPTQSAKLTERRKRSHLQQTSRVFNAKREKGGPRNDQRWKRKQKAKQVFAKSDTLLPSLHKLLF